LQDPGLGIIGTRVKESGSAKPVPLEVVSLYEIYGIKKKGRKKASTLLKWARNRSTLSKARKDGLLISFWSIAVPCTMFLTRWAA
jgi:hypothetical protein